MKTVKPIINSPNNIGDGVDAVPLLAVGAAAETVELPGEAWPFELEAEAVEVIVEISIVDTWLELGFAEEGATL